MKNAGGTVLDKRELTYEEILQLIKVFESSPEFNEFHLKFGDTIIDLRKHGAVGSGFGEAAATTAPGAIPRDMARTDKRCLKNSGRRLIQHQRVLAMKGFNACADCAPARNNAGSKELAGLA